MDCNKIKRFIISTLITLLILLPILYCIVDKPSIHESTIGELQEINGLGELLSSRVVIYLDTYPNTDIDDLTDVRGIGEKKLKLIRKVYGD